MMFFQQLNGLVSNSILLSAFFSWFLAQFLKIIIEIFKRNKFKTKDFIFRALFGTGGMPSSHSASVTSAAIMIGFLEGFGSSLFALAMVIAFIVIRDATGVRLSSGKQATALNQIMEEMYKRYNIEYKKVKVVKGHTALECFVGVLIGVFVALGMYFFK